MKKNRIIKAALIFLNIFLLNSTAIYSYEKKENNIFDIHWSIGSKGYYSSGVSDAYGYNKSNIKGELRSEYLDISAFIQRYFNYQLTNGSGTYDYRSFNEAGLSLTAHLFKLINLTGAYTRADDFNNLNRNTFNGIIEFDLNPVTINADCTIEKFKYEISTAGIKTSKRDCTLQLEYSFSDSFSADLGYTYYDIYLNTTDSTYYKNTGRAGFSFIPSNFIFLLGGAYIGIDSADYYIFGADCGITGKIYSHIKLSLSYNISYYYPPSSSKKGGSGGSGKTNPFLSSDKTEDPYFSHIVSIGLTLAF